MTSDLRKFDNFEQFPGSINDDKNLYEFPQLFKVNSKGKQRQWNIYIRLIKTSSKKQTVTRKYDWNLFEEIPAPIKKEYLTKVNNLKEGIISQVWTESGEVEGKISRYPATYPKVTNKGRANERNYLQQALVNARAKYLKKIEEGYLPKGKSALKTKVQTDKKYFPMLAKNYKDYVKKIKYPIYVQPKLDGLRCITYLDSLEPLESGSSSSSESSSDEEFDEKEYHSNIIMYSRQKKEYPPNSNNLAIKKSLHKILYKYYDRKTNSSIYLDGELYKHGVPLQEINKVRSSKGNPEEIIQYNIYDCFYPNYEKETFEERYTLLQYIYNELSAEEKKYIRLVETNLCNTKEEQDSLYKKYISEDYEGSILRNIDGPYAKHAIKKSTTLRSKDLLKRKEVYDSEFEVIDFTDGVEGKNKGAIVWICKVGSNSFKVEPKLPFQKRYKIYKECIADKGQGFKNKYEGRMLKVEYRGISNDGIPLHAKAIEFRDFE